MCVCNLQNKDCMLHHCDNCPNIFVLKKLKTGKLRENYYHDDANPFKQWQTTDKSNLVEVELDFYNFSDGICDQILSLKVQISISNMPRKICL